MTRKLKALLAVFGVVTVLAAGAFAWKSGKGPGMANGPAGQAKSAPDRTFELIAAERHTIKPRGLVDTVRFTGTTQPSRRALPAASPRCWCAKATV